MTFAIERTDDVRESLERLVVQTFPWVTSGSAVFVKPNLTYPHFKPGVTTTPTLIEALLAVLKDLGVRRVCVGEGEGGYNSFRMSDTLAGYGAERWEKQYGAEVAVVNDWPSMPVSVRNRHGDYTAHFPSALRDEFDGVLTLPVPKVHSMTVMSGAVKNQWGLVQDGMRLRLHLALSEILYGFHQQVQPVGVIIDGTHGLTRNGPMLEGVPLDLGWVAAASDVWTADMALAGIMRIDPTSVPYLKYALSQGIKYEDTSALWKPFEDERFYLRLNVWNRAARLTWHSPKLNYLVYFSPLSTGLHRVMYRFRKAPADLSVRGRDWS
jgi:uncharacterized protein (DUF362 family)